MEIRTPISAQPLFGVVQRIFTCYDHLCSFFLLLLKLSREKSFLSLYSLGFFFFSNSYIEKSKHFISGGDVRVLEGKITTYVKGQTASAPSMSTIPASIFAIFQPVTLTAVMLRLSQHVSCWFLN